MDVPQDMAASDSILRVQAIQQNIEQLTFQRDALDAVLLVLRREIELVRDQYGPSLPGSASRRS